MIVSCQVANLNYIYHISPFECLLSNDCLVSKECQFKEGHYGLVTCIVVTMPFHNTQYIMGYNIMAQPHGLTMIDDYDYYDDDYDRLIAF